MNRTLCKCICAFGLAVSALAGAPAHAGPYAALYLFGDSLSDTGNNALAFDAMGAGSGLPPGTLRTPTPLSLPDIIPTYPYASDRYSNGPVWADYFANVLGVTLLPSSLPGGTNYAHGGARTVMGAAASFPPSLEAQVGQFLTSGAGAPSDALYVIAGGGNDARDVLTGADAATTVSSYVSTTLGMIGALVGAGARDILLWNVPDIGLTPAVRLAGAGAAASGLVDLMNGSLLAALGTLSLPSDVDIDVLDVAGFLRNVAASPGDYGLIDVASACALDPACIADPSTTLFWDGIHPTTAGHEQLALAALAAIGVPEPGTLVLVLAALLALAWARRARREFARIRPQGRSS
ncbi:MAG: SGNH/GDSL hydrolase family protein [Zoogloeaceae bacterium]|nr:SGNH/GDSL hydrolase family protein [Zoogloeaceae bacterium]MCP5240438.1 SGNH/GDSL hydrolase family protein [Zoogloeaceae bacterium]MCP5253453.1 SGNH/GDSL hydrolase family protein [Zoogloeaceae bacterium]MCP5295531.1 SGNH/GDSL hydrolase family protein [Zoogloeaceae bacterium]MCW5614408.1 SGNH/GDSL hydrolase family protein [Rhodocyclaceae bacterium]